MSNGHKFISNNNNNEYHSVHFKNLYYVLTFLEYVELYKNANS